MHPTNQKQVSSHALTKAKSRRFNLIDWTPYTPRTIPRHVQPFDDSRMTKPNTYRCPVCKKTLTKKEFDRALHIHEAQQGRLQEWEVRLRNQERAMPMKL